MTAKTKKPATKKAAARRPSIATASRRADPKVKGQLAALIAGTPSLGAPAAKPAAQAAAKPTRETRVGLALTLIKAGKTNAEVQAALIQKFSLPPEHDYYARWYRAYAVQRGIITREFASAHSRSPEAQPAPAAKPAPEKKARRSAKK